MYESALKELNGRNAEIKPDDWQKYLQMWGYRQTDLDVILQRAEKITSDQLNADRRGRLLTLLKATKHEAPLDDVTAAAVSSSILFRAFGISSHLNFKLNNESIENKSFIFYRLICMDLRN